MTTLDLYDKTSIGVVYIPISCCKWVIAKYNLLEEWVCGKTFFDPTAGEGNFLLAFLELAVENQIVITEKMLGNLFANELDNTKKEAFLQRVSDKFDLIFPIQNWTSKDIILESASLKTDYLIGNPPWKNFTDLVKISIQTLVNPRAKTLGQAKKNL